MAKVLVEACLLIEALNCNISVTSDALSIAICDALKCQICYYTLYDRLDTIPRTTRKHVLQFSKKNSNQN